MSYEPQTRKNQNPQQVEPSAESVEHQESHTGPTNGRAPYAPGSSDARASGPTASDLAYGDPRSAVHGAAAQGVASPTRELPHAQKIQAAFGSEHDVSSIEAHVGGGTAKSMGAEAYATGNHVVFDKEPDLHTAAHEAAHVVQQKQGVQLYGGVGNAGDTYERNADAVADRVVQGESAADLLGPGARGGSPLATQSIQRKSATEAMGERYDALDENWQRERNAVADPTGDHVLDGGSEKATDLGGKHAGDAGYAAKLGKAGTSAAHDAMAKGEHGTIAPPVEPYTLTLDQGIHQQVEWIAAKEKEKEDKKYTPSNARDFFTLGLTQTQKDPSWVTVRKENSIARGGAQVAMLERHMFEQDRWVNSYNAWAPIANEAHMARADVIESAALMGFDLGKTEDMVKFVEGIEHGLDNATSVVDAKVAGPHGETSWSGRQGFKGEIGAGPQLEGEPLDSVLGELHSSYAAVNLAHFGIYENLLNARTAVLENTKFSRESKVIEINAAIQFVTDMSGAVDGGMKWANTAPASAESKLNHYAGEWAARRSEKKAVQASNDGHHAASRFEMERASGTRATSADAPASVGGPPTLAGMAGALTSLYFEEQLHTLQGQIRALQTHIDSEKAVKSLADAQAKIEAYADARRRLATAAKRVEVQMLAKREAQYLGAGDALDRYAVAHADQLKSQKLGHAAPRDAKHETYSSLMLMVAKIRAYMALSETARSTFDYDQFVESALRLASERRDAKISPELQSAPVDIHWEPPHVPKMGKQENHQVWEAIDSSYAAVFGFSERAKIQFGGIEDKVAKLLQKMKGVESKTNDVAENPY